LNPRAASIIDALAQLAQRAEVTACIEVRWEQNGPAGILGGVEEWESVKAVALAVEWVGPVQWSTWRGVYRVLPRTPAGADWRHYLVAEDVSGG
jgi:hypothetical protein